MAEPTPDERGQEIERLWAKVSEPSGGTAAPASAPAPFAPSAAADLAWETVALLKRQHRQQARYWSDLLEEKQRLLDAARERLAALEAETEALRRRAESGEALVLQETLEARAKLEAAAEALKERQAQDEEEEKALRALLAETRERLASETARFRQERLAWERKEQEYLIQAREREMRLSQAPEEAARFALDARCREEALEAAREGLEPRLKAAESSLQKERRSRAESEKGKAEVLKKADLLARRVKELEAQAEKERSDRESRAAELAAEAEKLKKEREGWLEERRRAQAPPPEPPARHPRAAAAIKKLRSLFTNF